MQQVLARVASLFRGRLSRKAYALYWFLPTVALSLAAEFVPDSIYDANFLLIETLFVILAVVGIPLGVRRFHDGGISGWWFAGPQVVILPLSFLDIPEGNEIADAKLLVAIMFGLLFAMWGFWTLYRLVIRAGDSGANRFGDDPLAPIATSAST